jgi:hypothetical protein
VVSCGVGTLETKTSEVGVVDFVLTACVGSTRNRGMVGDLYGTTLSLHVRRMNCI